MTIAIGRENAPVGAARRDACESQGAPAPGATEDGLRIFAAGKVEQ